MMPKRIPKRLIQRALLQGLITFHMEYDNLAAQIGDNWFYICSEYHKTEKDFTRKQLAEMIYESVNDEPINDPDEDQAVECLYYKYWLEEHVK